MPEEPEKTQPTQEKVEVRIDTSDLKKDIGELRESISKVSEAQTKLAEAIVKLSEVKKVETVTVETKGIVPPAASAKVDTSMYDGMLVEAGALKGQAMFMEQSRLPRTLQPRAEAVKRAQEMVK